MPITALIFRAREEEQGGFVAVPWDISLSHDNIESNEGHLGWVFSAALLPLPRHYLWESVNRGEEQERIIFPSLPPPFPPSGLLPVFEDF